MSTGLAAEPRSARAAVDGARPPLRRGASWAPPAALFAAAAALYAVLALRSPLPVLFPDELRYAHLARSLADGQGFTWRGDHVGQSAALYVYVLAPLWGLLHGTVDAYRASKVLGTLALCAQVFPVWLAGRALLGRGGALLAAALSVAGTWMLLSAGIVTEVLALPLATTALCFAVLALCRPGSRWWIGALAFVLLATWARIQLAVLVPALLGALVLDVLRVVPAERAARLRAHRAALLTTGVLSAVLVIVALAAPSVTGDYAGFFGLRPPLTRLLGKSALQLAELAAVTGVVPMLLAVGAATSSAAWRDARSGPLLAVLWPAALVCVAQSGFFLAGFTPATSGIQRYVAFAVAPALLLALVLVTDRRLLSPRVLAVAGLAGVLLLARPAITMMGEERAAWATAYRAHQVLGLGAGAALALVGLVLIAATALIAHRAATPGRAAAGFAAVLLAVLAVQDQAAWNQMTTTAASFRTQLPADLQWVDHRAGGPVALLSLTQTAPQYEDLEFFNRSIAAIYVPAAGLPGRPLQGRRCTYRFATSGALQVGPGCGPVPRRFLLTDPAAAITFRDEVRSVADPRIGRIAELAPGTTARARAVVVLACPRASPVYSSTSPDIVPAGAPRACNTTVSGSVWLDGVSDVVVRYRGGRDPHAVTVAGRRFPIAPGSTTTVRFGAPAGYSQFVLQQDWSSTDGAPSLVGASIVRGARSEPII
jgi:hypothetical protein